jgi:predicted site-specific integrase-resolvase
MNKQDKYIGGKQACEILGVHMQTLYNWEKLGKIEIIRHSEKGKRFYNIEKFLNENKQKTLTDKEKDIINEIDNKKINICYVRVSTLGQKNDLERQKEYMKKKYKKYELIEDIGSGINFNRKGLRKIIELAISGKINKLVVAHKDRLTRFGFDLIEHLITKYSNGIIILDDEKESKKEPKEELVDDVLQILNVYTAKMNGLRKYNKL